MLRATKAHRSSEDQIKGPPLDGLVFTKYLRIAERLINSPGASLASCFVTLIIRNFISLMKPYSVPDA